MARALAEANNRLAMVDDALLQLLVMDAWYPSDGDITEVTPMISAADQQQFKQVGTNKALAKLSQDHDIPECAATTPSKGQIATTVEALLGAVWYDSDMDLSKVKYVMDSLRDPA